MNFQNLIQANAFIVLEGVTDIDLLVLRGHALVEAFLWELLASRLGVPEAELPALNFDRLARLATAGDRYHPVREQLLLLNAIRNGIAHQFDPSQYREQLRDFVGRGATDVHAAFPTDAATNVTVTFRAPQEPVHWPDDRAEQLDLVRRSTAGLILALRMISISTSTPVYRTEGSPSRP